MIEPASMLNLVERLALSQVLCIGDLMLDRYVYGGVERTSPEAPVPVLRIERERAMLGGAGNVVRNVTALGARAWLIAVIGDDEVGRQLTTMVGKEPQLEPYLLIEAGRPSTVKTRFVAGNQQLLRADAETTRPIEARTAERLIALVGDLTPQASSIVISDYAKGVITPEVVQAVIARARAAGHPVVVDPKGADFARYRGASVVTPNRGELSAAVGERLDSEAAIVKGARALIERCGIEAVLVTRSHEGMTYVAANGRVEHLPAQAREVYDVSGAGDTAVATFAAALGQGVDPVEAALLANAAAGIVVGKTGTAVAHGVELQRAVRANDRTAQDAKLMLLPDAVDAVSRWRAEGKCVGFTNGCFDLLHPGHLALLRQARGACDRLVVGLNSDASVKRLKGPERPVQNEAARAEVLASLELVDLVVLFEADTPIALIEALRPDVLIKGADYALDQVVGGSFVQSYGGRVLLATLEPGFSTTRTIERLKR
ncbi:MAG: D-glycero-beta-D-manno-heptose-7-phosphate kinase [Alphaproteobacteria bacterium]|nr:D-glycero-beta-D-manno-heptose-7-phosphate kinase [Alphaproteobacteria bacterium]